MLALGAQMQWFLGALATMKSGQFPNLKALVYFDSTKDCGWNVDSSSASLGVLGDGSRRVLPPLTTPGRTTHNTHFTSAL
jgi:hypothetical protein